MVSLWPWSRADTSAASFERELSAQSRKIADTAARVDLRRQRARRFKALWTLYASFAYLLCLVLEALVVGWRSWGPVEASALAAAPVLIYLVRLALDTFYGQRVASLQRYLDELRAQREKTITKLKEATRYDSTHELLEKYGGADDKRKKGQASPQADKTRPRQQGQGQQGQQGPPQQRTNLPPPPTANIPGRQPSAPSTPQQQQQEQQQQQQRQQQQQQQAQAQASPPPPSPPGPDAFAESASFAPNAFAPPQQGGGAWYDRLLDVLLGEDETAARARLALVCGSCRLVNGLAPPGVKSLHEVGRWRCAACGAMNGEEEEAAEEVLRGIVKERQGETGQRGEESDVTVYSEDEEEEEEPEEKPATRRSARKKAGKA